MYTFAGIRILRLFPHRATRCLCGNHDDNFRGADIYLEDGRAIVVPFQWVDRVPDSPGWDEEAKRIELDLCSRLKRPVLPGRLPGQDGTLILRDPITEAFAIVANNGIVLGHDPPDTMSS